MTVNSQLLYKAILQINSPQIAKFVPIFYYKVSDIRNKALRRKNKIARLHSRLWKQKRKNGTEYHIEDEMVAKTGII